MLELEVQLPRERKIIEWDKASPTFCEVKERLGNCGIAKNWCVEILRGGEYVSPDDNTQLRDCKKLTVRAAPISEKTILEPGTFSGIGPSSLRNVFDLFIQFQFFSFLQNCMMFSCRCEFHYNSAHKSQLCRRCLLYRKTRDNPTKRETRPSRNDRERDMLHRPDLYLR